MNIKRTSAATLFAAMTIISAWNSAAAGNYGAALGICGIGLAAVSSIFLHPMPASKRVKLFLGASIYLSIFLAAAGIALLVAGRS